MSYKFSEPLRQILQEAGWYEGRRVDVIEAVQALEKVGFSVFPQAYQVIQEFEGLEAKGENNYTFCIPEIASYFEEEEVTFLNKLIEEALCPFAYGERVVLLISQSGKVVILHDEWTVYRLYNNLEAGLEAAFFVSDKPEFIWLSDEDKPVNFREENDDWK
jgi:hypothetical protein